MEKMAKLNSPANFWRPIPVSFRFYIGRGRSNPPPTANPATG